MPAKDITNKASCIERGTAILYRNRRPSGSDPASYGGLLKLPDSQAFWVFVWPRTVRNKPVVELKLVAKREGSGAND